MNIISEVKKLNLPLGQYVVCGSGPLQIRGIREAHDIDILVLPELFEKLRNKGWEEKIWKEVNGRYLKKDNVEIGDNWNCGEYNPDPKELIRNADIIEGIPFIKLEEVIKWKKVFGRGKDKKDIKLIERYLNEGSHST